MRHFAHHIGDYRAHTAHLSFVEDAAYRRMLDVYYMHERPLPIDLAAICRLAGARTKDERIAVNNVLNEFFQLTDDGWRQRRADKEIAAYHAKAEKARENGRGGGRPKTKAPSDGKPTSKPTDNRSGSVSIPTAKANHEPVREAPTGLPVTDQTPRPVAAREDGPGGADAHEIDVTIPKFLRRAKEMPT